MNWQWMLFFIVSYVGGAYVLRAMAKLTKTKTNNDYSGLTAAWVFSPIWFWFWALTVGLESGFRGLGRWISGE
jgi:hypothetical protein